MTLQWRLHRCDTVTDDGWRALAMRSEAHLGEYIAAVCSPDDTAWHMDWFPTEAEARAWCEARVREGRDG